MAKLFELDEAAWNAWVETRPEVVQALCRKLPPDRLYLLKTSGHRVLMHSYSESGTVTVNVTGEYNLVTFARSVFGVNPDDLEECDLPPPDAPIGEMLTETADVEAFCAAMRETHNASLSRGHAEGVDVGLKR